MRPLQSRNVEAASSGRALKKRAPKVLWSSSSQTHLMVRIRLGCVSGWTAVRTVYSHPSLGSLAGNNVLVLRGPEEGAPAGPSGGAEEVQQQTTGPPSRSVQLEVEDFGNVDAEVSSAAPSEQFHVEDPRNVDAQVEWTPHAGHGSFRRLLAVVLRGRSGRNGSEGEREHQDGYGDPSHPERAHLRWKRRAAVVLCRNISDDHLL